MQIKRAIKKGLLASGAGAMALALVGLHWPIAQLEQTMPLSTIMVDKNGQLLGASIAKDEQWRFPAPKQLPEKYITALLAFEDKRFYTHPGVDPLALGRAMWLNLRDGRVVSGGSTLTMQLARMLEGNKPRTYSQKLKEMALALRLDWQLSKEEILIRYSAMAPYGGNTVGLHSANWRYFSSPLEYMSWAQATLFAVLPNSPAAIHPGRDRARLKAKRDKLLGRLHEEGMLDDLELELAQLEALPARPNAMPNSAPHLLAHLKKQYPDTQHFRVPIQPNLQHHIQSLAASYNQALLGQNVNNLAALVIDNQSQEVIAYLGNSTLGKGLNAAPQVDVIQSPRSSGSVFKPFLFAMMLQRGQLLPETLVTDIPSYFGGYQPQNYDRQYRGLVPAKQALSQSLNVPAVRMLQEYGVAKFKDDLQDLGMTHLWRPAEDYGLSLILGGAETSLWDITQSFSRLMLSASGITEAATSPALHSQQAKQTETFAIGVGAAWLTTEALREVNRPGIAANWQAFNSSQPIAWKTGTSYGLHDAWAVGSNGRYTVGVWAGNANGEEARELSGTQTAAPLMFDIFHHLPVGEWPAKPEYALKSYRVCDADGHLPTTGCITHAVDAPIEADYTRVSPYHQRIHLDASSGLRVHGLCESPSKMQTEDRFVLPPVHHNYYTGAKPLPPWREDCLSSLATLAGQLPFSLEYPLDGAQVRIPIELDGEPGRVILRARHRNQKATLHWHLDQQYLGETQYLHEQAVLVNPGWHKLTLTDQNGRSLTQWFRSV